MSPLFSLKASNSNFELSWKKDLVTKAFLSCLGPPFHDFMFTGKGGNFPSVVCFHQLYAGLGLPLCYKLHAGFLSLSAFFHFFPVAPLDWFLLFTPPPPTLIIFYHGSLLPLRHTSFLLACPHFYCLPFSGCPSVFFNFTPSLCHSLCKSPLIHSL